MTICTLVTAVQAWQFLSHGHSLTSKNSGMQAALFLVWLGCQQQEPNWKAFQGLSFVSCFCKHFQNDIALPKALKNPFYLGVMRITALLAYEGTELWNGGWIEMQISASYPPHIQFIRGLAWAPPDLKNESLETVRYKKDRATKRLVAISSISYPQGEGENWLPLWSSSGRRSRHLCSRKLHSDIFKFFWVLCIS